MFSSVACFVSGCMKSYRCGLNVRGARKGIRLPTEEINGLGCNESDIIDICEDPFFRRA